MIVGSIEESIIEYKNLILKTPPAENQYSKRVSKNEAKFSQGSNFYRQNINLRPRVLSDKNNKKVPDRRLQQEVGLNLKKSFSYIFF